MSVNNSRGAGGDRPPDQRLLLLDDRRPRLIRQGIMNQLHSLYIYLKLQRLDSSAAGNTISVGGCCKDQCSWSLQQDEAVKLPKAGT